MQSPAVSCSFLQCLAMSWCFMCFDANLCGLIQTHVLSRRGMRCSTDTFATMQTKLANPTLLQMTDCNPIKLKEIARVCSTAVQQIEEE